MVKLTAISPIEILKAKKNLNGIIYRTPLIYSSKLSEIGGSQIYLKLENLQKTGAFKIRGAYNVISSIPPNKRRYGVITASSGNFGIAVSLVAKMLDLKATIVVPEIAPKSKLEKIKSFKASIVQYGKDLIEAQSKAEELVENTGAVYLDTDTDPVVMAGQGTIACEILEDMPDTDVILVPAGPGNILGGISVWAKSINPSIKIYGVQSTKAHTLYECFRKRKIVDVPFGPTICDGLGGKVNELTFNLALKHVEDIILTEEEELIDAIMWMLKNEHQIIEGSAIVGPAAILQKKIQFKASDKVVIVITGGNIDMDLFLGKVS
jgi:threonine dehydratase